MCSKCQTNHFFPTRTHSHNWCFFIPLLICYIIASRRGCFNTLWTQQRRFASLPSHCASCCLTCLVEDVDFMTFLTCRNPRANQWVRSQSLRPYSFLQSCRHKPRSTPMHTYVSRGGSSCRRGRALPPSLPLASPPTGFAILVPPAPRAAWKELSIPRSVFSP